MGAVEFFTSARGKDINEAYRNACDDAEDEHGHEEGYSGAINSTYGFSDVTNEFANSKMKMDAFMEKKLENCEKGDCYAIKVIDPQANTNKVKSKVENLATPGAKRWLLKYVAQTRMGDRLGMDEYKADAIKKARAHTEKTGQSTEIVMVKVLDKGSNIVAKITYKGTNNEKAGKWSFFGVAPY